MFNRVITSEDISAFETSLQEEEKSAVTISKYLHDAGLFARYISVQPITKELVIEYKQKLINDGKYENSSINSIIASINKFLKFLGLPDCTVKSLKLQRQIYCSEKKELSKSEYKRLIDASNDRPRLQLIIKTICSTGIRVSELKYFTVESLVKGEVSVKCKNKLRTVILPGKLRKLLIKYAKQQKIECGILFRTRSGKPVSRCNIWSDMKSLCKRAQVDPEKVFPHNLRKLFARTFYGIEKDISKLADILGHSSINTTRIYLMSSGKEHRERIEKLGLVV